MANIENTFKLEQNEIDIVVDLIERILKICNIHIYVKKN